MKRVTAKWLLSLGACTDEVKRFRDEWPRGCAVTLTNALRAVELGLDFDWLAYAALPDATREAYRKAIAPVLVAALKELEAEK